MKPRIQRAIDRALVRSALRPIKICRCANCGGEGHNVQTCIAPARRKAMRVSDSSRQLTMEEKTRALKEARSFHNLYHYGR